MSYGEPYYKVITNKIRAKRVGVITVLKLKGTILLESIGKNFKVSNDKGWDDKGDRKPQLIGNPDNFCPCIIKARCLVSLKHIIYLYCAYFKRLCISLKIRAIRVGAIWETLIL